MDLNQVRVMYRIHEKTEVGEFNDALYFSLADWETLQPAEIDIKVAARVQNFVTAVKNPPATREVTRAELEEYEAELSRQLTEVRDKLSVRTR